MTGPKFDPFDEEPFSEPDEGDDAIIIEVLEKRIAEATTEILRLREYNERLLREVYDLRSHFGEKE